MLTQNMKNCKSIEKLSLSKMLNVTLLDSKKPNQEPIKEAKRINLIHLCKDRTLSNADERKAYKNNLEARLSEERTDSSSIQAKSSLTSSPMMTTLEFEDYTNLSKPSQIQEERVTLANKSHHKHIEYYCQPNYKLCPNKSALPPPNF